MQKSISFCVAERKTGVVIRKTAKGDEENNLRFDLSLCVLTYLYCALTYLYAFLLISRDGKSLNNSAI